MTRSNTKTGAGAAIDHDRIRSAFPALAGDTVFMENAGGSQVPEVVANAIRDYLLESYVQLGAGYGLSQRATDVVSRAHDFANVIMNGDPDSSEVVLGPSSTALVRILAESYGKTLPAGSEIVIAANGHESNIGPWAELESHGMRIRWWEVDRDRQSCTPDGLRAVLTDRTKIVAFPHVSNLLGEVVDVQAVTRLAHEAGARVVVDGVAFAPHRAIDVRAWNVDWYFYSAYKVYGPHMGALYGTHDAFAGLPGPNHFFIADGDVPYKFEPGGVSHEGCAGLLALGSYLRFLVDPGLSSPGDAAAKTGIDGRGAGACTRDEVERAFGFMSDCELVLQEPLMEYLAGRADLTVVGPEASDASRVPTISFRHDTLASGEIARRIDPTGIAIRAGHMYAWRLCEALGFPVEDGVVRISLVHYNTPGEVERLIRTLDEVLEA